jgi:hypothetical protein
MKHLIWTTLLVLMSAASAAWSQGEPPADSPPMPPQVRLGRRVLAFESTWQAIPTVVIVSDATSYLEAVSAWTLTRKFPVLIDLGDASSREEIARFVRAFRPKQVVRWTAPQAKGAGADTFAKVSVEAAHACVISAWEGEGSDQAAVISRLQALKHLPAGVVVMQPSDPAWTGGVALAAGRMQPITFVNSSQNFGGAFNTDGARALAGAITDVVKGMPWSWEDLGDNIDAVTMATNIPIKYDPGTKPVTRLATTDLIGRFTDGPKLDKRWAWCGQVSGDSARSASRAMCSLFLKPQSAWVFDGYSSEPGWKEYDGTAAAQLLRKDGLEVTLDDEPAQGAADWRARCAAAMKADLALVMTKGNSTFFDLSPGQCRAGDIPILTYPAAVHFVHSWSAQTPDDPATIAGRWLDRGVYAYFGSVDEPRLNAFVPTKALAIRFSAGAPFVASARLDSGFVWKTASLADPLLTFGPPLVRASESLPLTDSKPINADLRETLKKFDFVEGIRVLSLMGQDEQIDKLITTMLENEPARVTPAVAREAILPLFRSGRTRAVLALFTRLDAPARREREVLDALWLAAYPLIKIKDPEAMELLSRHMRQDQLDKDQALLAGGN